MRITRFLFLATVFWSRSRRCTGTSPGRSASPTCSRSASSSCGRSSGSRAATGGCPGPRRSSSASGLPSCSSTCSATTRSTRRDARAQFGKGIFKWAIHILFLVAGRLVPGAALGALLLADDRRLHRRDRLQRRLRRPPARRRAGRARISTTPCFSPLTGGASSINIYGAVGGQSVYRPERPDRRSEPSRDHADRPAARPAARSTCGSPAATGCAGSSRSCSASCSSSSWRRSPAAACSASASAC